MIGKIEFKAKLDGSFERKLREAYMAGFEDGREDETFGGGRFVTVATENLFQSWLKDSIDHCGILRKEELEI